MARSKKKTVKAAKGKKADLIEVMITRAGVNMSGCEVPIGAIVEISKRQLPALINKCVLADPEIVDIGEANTPPLELPDPEADSKED